MRPRTDFPIEAMRPRAVAHCAQCGATLLTPDWTEHLNNRCVRHLWSCEACGYEFETSIYLAPQ
jgi:hypothetical protein